jgi:hypothetical protein
MIQLGITIKFRRLNGIDETEYTPIVWKRKEKKK